MAAGMGSRFGGLKQLTPVGPNGEFLIDYSIYDAKQAGVNKVIFVIKKEMEQSFKETIGKRIKKNIEVSYVYQELEETPIKVNTKRQKPWGTGQALLTSEKEVNSPFMVINADDFYGRDAFLKLGEFLRNAKENQYAMVAYPLKNTLSDNGCVSRGICEKEGNYLKKITECPKIQKKEGKMISYDQDKQHILKENTLVSLNLFGFTPSIFKEAKIYFKEFLSQKENLETQEFYLPAIVQKVIDSKKANVFVLSTTSNFYGMTYHKDLENLQKNIEKLIQKGVYPKNLWEE